MRLHELEQMRGERRVRMRLHELEQMRGEKEGEDEDI